MAKRHDDALFISAGACNPSGMAHSLVSACREVLAEGGSQATDPAIRLIVHQIAYICGVHNGVEDFVNQPDFAKCSQLCREAVNDVTEAPHSTAINMEPLSGVVATGEASPIYTDADLEKFRQFDAEHSDKTDEPWSR